jgi:integrase
LSHTNVSSLIKGGRTAKEIQHWVGHDSIIQTMDTHGHLFPDHLAMVGAEIDKIFEDVSAEPDKSFTTVA